MDIRDIKEEVKYPVGAFENLFALQRTLLKKYQDIEALPKAPLDINTKESQTWIKDFTGRIIEELGEGFESYEIMMDMFHNAKPESEMIPHLQNFNEEIADAMHFWLELMIYSGYGMITIEKWLLKSRDHSINKKTDFLSLWMRLGHDLVNQEIPVNSIPCRWVINNHELAPGDEFLMGGRQLGTKRRDLMKQYLWDITYHLQLARNTLKNKRWKQTGVMTDTSQYENQLMLTCIALFKFFAFSGFTRESLFVIYYKKNKVNQFRIKSKY